MIYSVSWLNVRPYENGALISSSLWACYVLNYVLVLTSQQARCKLITIRIWSSTSAYLEQNALAVSSQRSCTSLHMWTRKKQACIYELAKAINYEHAQSCIYVSSQNYECVFGTERARNKSLQRPRISLWAYISSQKLFCTACNHIYDQAQLSFPFKNIILFAMMGSLMGSIVCNCFNSRCMILEIYDEMQFM